MNNTEAPLSAGTAAFTVCNGLPRTGVANGRDVGLEAVLILSLCFGAHLLPGILSGEVGAHEKRAV